MTSSHVCRRALAASFFAVGLGLALVPTASADDMDQPAPPVPAPAVEAQAPASALPVDSAPPADGGQPAMIACAQFAQALEYASVNYSDFADSIAFGGPQLDFSDPLVQSNNVVGRTALREAAGVAMAAAGTPGLQPEIANPMRSWSLHATKLLLLMGLHSGSDTIDDAAAQVNTDTHDVQMGCAQAGTHA